MDLRTIQALKLINLHLQIKKILSFISYLLIIGGFLIYVFFAIDKNNQKFKLVADYAKNPEQYKTEKIMVNPRIKFQHNGDKIYDISAKRAIHKNEEEVSLYDVRASGAIGNIMAGELKIDQGGDHLVFSQNPVLILNQY